MAPLTQTKTTEGGTGQTTASPAVGNAVGQIPFTQASNRHREPGGYSNNFSLPGATQITPFAVLAYGYLRSLVLTVTITPTGGTPVFAADAPWNIFSNLTVKEPNGTPIYSLDGYGAYLAMKYGGYRNVNDPKLIHGYSAAAGAATFRLRIPLETSLREALGALPNQANNAAFQVTGTLNPLSTIYSSAPTSAVVNVTITQEEWDQPLPTNGSASNETAPPAVNTTQFWQQVNRVVTTGYNEVQFTRVGNLIRNLILVTRNASGVRADLLPTLTNLTLDNQVLDIVPKDVWQMDMSESFGYSGTLDAAGALDTGVYVVKYTDDFSGKPGFETRNLWLPTMPQTRFAINGNGWTLGSMDVYTNDVIPANPVQVG